MATPALRISTGPYCGKAAVKQKQVNFKMTALKIPTPLPFSFHPCALDNSALTHCLYPSMITAPKDFTRAGQCYGFICSWVLSAKGLFLILTNSTLTSLTQKSYSFLYTSFSFIFPFSGHAERISLNKQYISIAILSFMSVPPISFPTPIEGWTTRM